MLEEHQPFPTKPANNLDPARVLTITKSVSMKERDVSRL
jgi:hypothetical protein